MPKLKEESIKWAIMSVLESGDSYLFPKPFEFEAIRANQDKVISAIKNMDLGSFSMKDYRTSICPKSTKGFRIATQLDPIDSVLTHAILYEIAKDIEKYRIPVRENIVYSYRLKPLKNGQLYRKDIDFQKFRTDILTSIDLTNCRFILETDISDFYPSIYMHDIEQCMSTVFMSTNKLPHANALKTMCNVMHLHQTHKGLPVGPQFSRPIAELVLHDIDTQLLREQIKYKRYVDDFVFFCENENKAYQTLSRFAQMLFELRGLKLNESKTNILSKAEYKKKYISDVRTKTNQRQIHKLQDLLSEAGIETDSYEEIDINDLDDNTQKKIKRLNLKNILSEELEQDEPDMWVIGFIINNLARLDDESITDLLLNKKSLRKLSHKLSGIVRYLIFIRSYSKEKQIEIGKKIINIIKDSYVAEVPFNRAWLLNIFFDSQDWNNILELRKFWHSYSDPMTKRKLLLAMFGGNDVESIKAIKQTNPSSFDPWARRAFLLAMSKLSKDEKRPWFKSYKRVDKSLTEELVYLWLCKGVVTSVGGSHS